MTSRPAEGGPRAPIRTVGPSSPQSPLGSRDVRVYADGSALVRYLPGPPHAAAWQEWAAEHEPELLVTSLSLGELRAAAAQQPTDVRLRALDVLGRLEEVRYFDQALRVASMSTAVLSPFAALHLGIAVAHPEIGGYASYDRRLVQVAAMHGLRIVSPGLPDRWWDAG
jgi:hypothetical protein